MPRDNGRMRLPALRLDHLRRLTDEHGIVQFARLDKPDPSSGYCVDDVARLAIVAARLGSRRIAPDIVWDWIDTALDFLYRASEPHTGLMRNFAGAGGEWLDEPHPGDHIGRTLWALGELRSAPLAPWARRKTLALRRRLTPWAARLTTDGVRSAAYAILGLATEPCPQLYALASYLDTKLQTVATADWHWFEASLSYDNARLPQALLAAAVRLDDTAMARRALASLDWYCTQVVVDTGVLRCVGNTWRRRGQCGAASEGDEQPIDAAALTEALIDAFAHTGDARYTGMIRRSFSWFMGDNGYGQMLYDASTGGCRDGVGNRGMNENQGAESTLAYYQALSRLLIAGLGSTHG